MFGGPGASICCRAFCGGVPPSKILGKRKGRAVEKSTHVTSDCIWRVELVLFSRAFIRKRMISLATTASVGAISFVSAQVPAKTHHVRHGRQYVGDPQEGQQNVPSQSGGTPR